MKKSDKHKKKAPEASSSSQPLEEQIRALDREMDHALSVGEYKKAKKLAEEQEKLLERLMGVS